MANTSNGMSIRDVCARIEAWCEQYAPEVLGSLNPGATEAQVEAAETHLGVTLPADVREVYRWRNGQNEDGNSLFPAGDWLSLEDACEQWDLWEGLRTGGDFEGAEADPDAGVRNRWWHSGWFPFTHNGSGDHLCVDCDPADGGTFGQIITMWHDYEKRSVEAKSLTAWLGGVADGLESGEFVFSEEYTAMVRREDVKEGQGWRGVAQSE